MGAVVCGLHADHGVRLRCGVGVHRARGQRPGRGGRARRRHRCCPPTSCVVGIGATPNVELAGRAPALALGNGVLCDAGGRPAWPGVVAVGDCAAWYDPRVGTAPAGSSTGPARSSDRGAAVAGAAVRGRAARAVPARRTSGPTSTACRIQFAGTPPAGDRSRCEDGRPRRAQLPRRLPPRRRAGRRARHEPGPPVHPLAPPARRGRRAGRAGRQPAGPCRLEMTRSPTRPRRPHPRRRPRSVRDPRRTPRPA